MLTNSEFFEEELSWIQNHQLRSFATSYVDLFPDYFAMKPSSSTHKHHPAWANTEGGLRKHTKGVAYFTHTLAEAYGLKDEEKDAALVAALGHDALKYAMGGGQHTSRSHAAEGAMFFKRVTKLLNYNDLPLLDQIYLAISDHMGRWGDGNRDFPEGFPRLSQLVHVADMAASRPQCEFKFLQPKGSLIG
jgi:hypothetical protein